MERRRHPGACVLLAAALATVAPETQGWAAPFTSIPTLTEQFAQADAALLVKYIEGQRDEGGSPEQTTFEILQVGTNTKRDGTLKKGEQITLPEFCTGKPGELYLLLLEGGTSDWRLRDATSVSFDYLVAAPAPEEPTAKRLEYFVNFLEHPDRLAADSAYEEFDRAPLRDVVRIADKLPAAKVRQWVTDPNTPPERLSIYGILLGLCGNSKDAAMMEEAVRKNPEDFRLGIDGMMSGYLLLTGESGLDMIDEQKLRDKSIPFSETFAGMLALRFMWQYAPGRIAPQRLQQSMRILLDRPELVDLVIADLARWKDWGVQAKLFSMYGAEEYDIPSIKRAIVRYFILCTKDVPEGELTEKPKHVRQAEEYLAMLRKRDPRTAAEAERIFFIPARGDESPQ